MVPWYSFLIWFDSRPTNKIMWYPSLPKKTWDFNCLYSFYCKENDSVYFCWLFYQSYFMALLDIVSTKRSLQNCLCRCLKCPFWNVNNSENMEHDMRVCSFDDVEKAVFVAFAKLTENCTILQVRCYTYSCLFVQSGDKCNSITVFELSWLKKRRFTAHFAVPIWYIWKNIFYVGSTTMVNIWPLEQCETHYPPTFHLAMIMVKFSNATLLHSLNWIAQNLASNSLSSHLEHVLV